MLQRKTLISLLLCITLFSTTTFAIASDNIELTHSVTSSPTDPVVLSITINNTSNQDLYGSTLIPTGNDFSTREDITTISIGDLFANGTATVEWTANTTMPLSYFNSGLPLFFHLKATNALGEEIEISVHSLGVSQ